MAASSDRLMFTNIALLAVAQSLLLTTVVGGMAISALAGRALTADPALATLPIAALVVGPFLTSWPASLLMARYGRRAGFTLGAALGIVGGAVSAAGIAGSDFWLFSFGHLLIGAFQGFGNYYRFTAMEAATEDFRDRAMSWVIAAGVVAAFAGPALAHATRPLGPIEYLGSYLAMAGLGILSWLVVRRLRLTAPQSGASPQVQARPLREIVTSYPLVVAVTASAVGYTVMILAMTATPLAMAGCGHGLAESRTVIQWHVLGMFAPSFVTGRLIQRFGAARVAMSGLALLAGHVGVAVSGVAMLQFTSALVLLGVGWNFTFLGGTALLGRAHAPSERAKVQAFNEFVVLGLSALASLSAGWLLVRIGWEMLNLLLLAPIALGGLVLLPLAAPLSRQVLRPVSEESR